VNIRRGRRPKPLASSKHRVTPLGTALRAWRDYRGLSQTALAIHAGLGVARDGRAHISSIELGKIQQPEDETLEKIGAVLGVTPNDLRSGRMPPPGQTSETLSLTEEEKQELLATTPSRRRGAKQEIPTPSGTVLPAPIPVQSPEPRPQRDALDAQLRQLKQDLLGIKRTALVLVAEIAALEKRLGEMEGKE
jgi:transcriptional regulator with XRE-family HTH domain